MLTRATTVATVATGTRRTRVRVAVGAALAACTVCVAAFAGPVEDGNAGLDAMKNGDYDAAIRLFTHAIASPQLKGDDREFAYYQRGVAYLYKRNFISANADLQRAVAMKPDDEDAQDALNLAKASRTPDDAAAPAREAEAAPSRTPARSPAAASPPAPANSSGGFLGVLGRAFGAELKQSLCQNQGVDCDDTGGQQAGQPGGQAQPNTQPHPHTASMDDGAAGMRALDNGQYDRAIRMFTRAINAGDLYPDDAELAYFNRAKAYFQRGDAEMALSDLSHALKLNASDADAQAAVAQVMTAHRHPPGMDAPQDAATCAASAKSSGSFITGKTYVASAAYSRLSRLDAYAAAFNYASSKDWTVTAIDWDAGTITATHAIAGSPRVLTLTIKVDRGQPQGSTTTASLYVDGLLIVTDAKGEICRFLAALPQ